MAEFTDVGYAIGGLTTLLQGSLPAKLNTLDAEYSDSITLGDVDNIDYFWAELDRYPTYPAIVIKPTLDQTGDQGGAFNLQTQNIQIHVLIASNESYTGTFYGVASKTLLPQEVAIVRLLRTMRGIMELLRDARTLPISAANTVEFTDITPPQFFDFEVVNDSTFIAPGVIRVACLISP